MNKQIAWIASLALGALGSAAQAQTITAVYTTYSSTGVPTKLDITGTAFCTSTSTTSCGTKPPVVKLGGNTVAISGSSPTGIGVPLTGVFADGDYLLSVTPSGKTAITYAFTLKSKAGGAAGPQGPAGPVGPAGPQGPQGLQGDTGAAGADGAPGVQGAAGATGSQGPMGLQGIKGDKGDIGAQGPIGVAPGTVFGDLLYWNGSAWTRLAPPTGNGVYLQYCNGSPQWTNSCATQPPANGDGPVQWTVASGGNGHWYEVVPVELDWFAAKTAAQQRAHLGMTGHLATLTSDAERLWVADNLLTIPRVPSEFWIWIGAKQNTQSTSYSEPAGGWEWVTGETWDYTGWGSGEPNNGYRQSPAIEECAIMLDANFVRLFPTYWIDGVCTDSKRPGYLVEYDDPRLLPSGQVILGAASVIGQTGYYNDEIPGHPEYAPPAIFDHQVGEIGVEITATGYWINAENGVADAYITFDLGAEYQLSRFELFNSNNPPYADRGTGSFEIAGGNSLVADGSRGYTLASPSMLVQGTLPPVASGTATLPRSFSVASSGKFRYLQFRPTSIGAINPHKPISYGLNELRVFTVVVQQ